MSRMCEMCAVCGGCVVCDTVFTTDWLSLLTSFVNLFHVAEPRDRDNTWRVVVSCRVVACVVCRALLLRSFSSHQHQHKFVYKQWAPGVENRQLGVHAPG